MRERSPVILPPHYQNPVLLEVKVQIGKPYKYHQGAIYTHRVYDKKDEFSGYEVKDEVNLKYFLQKPTFLVENRTYQDWLNAGAVTEEGKAYFATEAGKDELAKLEELLKA